MHSSLSTQRSALLVLLTFVGWFGMYLHNRDLPGLTLMSPENSLPALVSATLVLGWRVLPWKRTMLGLLLGWSLLHLVGGGLLSVLPLPIWPFTPIPHYEMHLLYGLAQLPIILLLVHWLRAADHREGTPGTP